MAHRLSGTPIVQSVPCVPLGDGQLKSDVLRKILPISLEVLTSLFTAYIPPLESMSLASYRHHRDRT